jgi:zinc protease
MMTRGTKNMTRQVLDDELDTLSAVLRGSGSTGVATFRIQCKRETLPDVLNLFGTVLREPSFPQDEFDILTRRVRESLLEAQADPESLASTALNRKLSPYPADDIRYVPTLEESMARIDALKLEQVKKLYTEQLGAASGELTVVGDFEGIDVPALLEKSLAGWKSAVKYVRIRYEAKTDVKGEQSVIPVADKANAVYVAGFNLALQDTDPDYAPLEIANFLLGGGDFSSRLGKRVRQQEGLSYGIGSQLSAGAIDKVGDFQVYAISNPMNIGKVETLIREELDKLVKDGVTAKELEEVKKAYLAQLKTERASNTAIMATLAEGLRVGRTMQHEMDLEKKIKALTVEEVNAAVKRHIDPKKLVIVQAGDLKPKK